MKSLPDGQPQQLTHGENLSYPHWSLSGEWLLAGEQVMRSDGSDRRVAPGCLAWSPAADRLACVTADHKIRVEDADGGSPVQFDPAPLVPGIDPGAISRLGPYWSPDGSALAYVLDAPLVAPGNAPQPRYSSLWIAKPDGTNARELLSNQTYAEAGQIGLFDWSQDGMLLSFNPAFSASIYADGLPLYLLSANGGTPRKLDGSMLTRDELFGGFSATGALAITEGSGRETWTNKRIAIVDVMSGSLDYLTGADNAAFSPAWSPDGQSIAYVSGPDIGSVGGGDPARNGMAQRHIWLMQADGSDQRQLTDDATYRDERPQWAADGSHILFTRLDVEDRTSLWLMPASGGQSVKVADISRPVAPQSAPLWFGYYGYITWDSYFDWWLP